LLRVTRTDSGFDRKALVDVRFVPALPGIERALTASAALGERLRDGG
jgi:hypothetical protein